MKTSPYIEFLRTYLGADEDALTWVLAFNTYAHAIDDIIDGDIPPKSLNDKEFVVRTFEFAAIIYSHIFYQRNQHILYSLVKMVTNTYMDSLHLEQSPEAWKQKYADVLRQSTNELVLACIEIVGGYNKRREASLSLREIAYHAHHTVEGTPI